MNMECVLGMSLNARTEDIANPEKMEMAYYRYVMENRYDAMLCGSNTIAAAQCAEEPQEKVSDQTLIVIDSTGKISNWKAIKMQPWWNDQPVVLCSETTPGDYLTLLKREGIRFILTGRDKVDLTKALAILGRGRKIESIRVDSGKTLLNVLLGQNLLDTLTLIIAPQIDGKFKDSPITHPMDVSRNIKLDLVKTGDYGNGYFLLKYKVLREEAANEDN